MLNERLNLRTTNARARAAADDATDELRDELERGEIVVPQITAQPPILAGGVNHCPNSDGSFSKMAATVAGTLPGAAGDTNQECYRYFRQQVGANIDTTAAGALKAVGHSAYAADEGVNLYKPVWDRVNGWVVLGAAGGVQYDIAIQLLGKVVSGSQPWFVRPRLVALDPTLVPADVELYAGFWEKTATSEGWLTGTNFELGYHIEGTPGVQALEYRVVAKTDSGLVMLSAVLVVPDGPAVLSESDYVRLTFTGAAGFIEFDIFRKQGGLFYHLYSIRNSTDLSYNDTGAAQFGRVEDWPTVTQAAPQALAQTRSILIGSFGGAWQPNDLKIIVPPTYNYSLTNADGLFLRIGFSAPTGVDRQLGLDRIWLGATFNEWAPDVLPPFPDGTYPIPSIAPTSSYQGGGDGVGDPPPDGSGGGTCVALDTPILTNKGRGTRWLSYARVLRGAIVPGEQVLPYAVSAKRGGTVSEYLRIETKNGIWIECSTAHRLLLSVTPRRTIAARRVTPGVKLACWVRGRRTLSAVKRVDFIPRPLAVGTFTLRHLGGLVAEGRGVYVAGHSARQDRGLFNSNTKHVLPL